jgi:hypothetical protein
MMNNKIFVFFIFIFLTTSSSYARLGETEQQSIKRYGKPVKNKADTVLPLLKNAVNRTYEYQGWRIRAAFLNDHAVRIAYSKLTKPGQSSVINKDEMKAILTAEAHGGEWKQGKNFFGFTREAIAKSLSQRGKLWWTHSKGLKARMKTGNLVMFVESPEAEIWEQAIENEKKVKQKESIPKF